MTLLPLLPPVKFGDLSASGESARGLAHSIYRWRGHAVKFHDGLGARVYSLVSDEEATAFPTVSAAMTCADLHNLAWSEITIVC